LFPRLKWNKLLGLYRAWYFDLNVHHFHEKLKQEHHIALTYTAGYSRPCKRRDWEARSQARHTSQVARAAAAARILCATGLTEIAAGLALACGFAPSSSGCFVA